MLSAGSRSPDQSVSTDGRRYLAFQPTSGDLRILDTDRGRTRAVTIAPDCPMGAMGYGVLLLACVNQLVSLSDGVVSAARGAHESDAFYALGGQWLQGTGVADVGVPADVFVNWHTGERRTITGHRNVQELNGLGPLDLNRAHLPPTRRCSHQWILSSEGSTQVITATDGRLLLQRCRDATGAGRTLDRCRAAACSAVQLAGGVVSWVAGASVITYRLRSGRVRAWRVPTGRDALVQNVSAAHTRRWLAAAVTTRSRVTGTVVTRYFLRRL